MNKKFLYVPIVLLFAFSASALIAHYSRISQVDSKASREAALPFGYNNGRVLSVSDAEAAAGIRGGDTIEFFNGINVRVSEEAFDREMNKLRAGEPIELTMSRPTTDGQREQFTATITPTRVERDLAFYSKYVTGFLFMYGLPTVSILLGFWVLFVRPADPLAWILLFVLQGVSSLSLEMYWDIGTLLGAYQKFYFSAWALSMLLFGIYFPERWTLDQRLPWLKWLFIIPLSFQVLLILLSILQAFTGVNLFWLFGPLPRWYSSFGFFVNMLAIGAFFAAIAHKAFATKNPDARRRLHVMLFGTQLAITPSFILVLYKVISQKQGSFLEIVPFWIGLLAIAATLLFPLTMAYVIVVQRAMDVRVVIRQGLQYGLAKGGVRALQFLLLLGIGLGVFWSINRYGSNFSTQLAFIVGGVALVPLIDLVAKPLRIMIDRRFFRDAYDAEQILTELSEDVRTMVETQPLLETVGAKISESLHVPQVAILLKNGEGFSPAHTQGFDTAPVVTLGQDSLALRKLRTNRHIALYDDMSEITSTPTVSLDEREQFRELNTQILMPLAVKNELTGIISLSPKLSEEPYSASDLRLLRSVATQTGLALENSRLTEAFAKEAAQKERLNAELEIAREVQERLFPQELPPVKGVDYYGACRPALGVGGDYYDFLELPDGKFGIAIGDVSGKGIGASLMMASLQASLRGQAIHSGDDLAMLMTRVNRLVYEASTTNRYATFFYGQFDPQTHTLSYVNAGHNPPFLIRGHGTVETLETGGPVIGMLPPMIVSYEMGTVEMRKGDLLVGFTDGISEAMNPADEEWGEDAMLAELKTMTAEPAREILEAIVKSADRFADGAKQHDDMTMIVVRLIHEQ